MSREEEGFAPELLAVALYKGETPQDLGEDAATVVSDGDFSGKTKETALLYGQSGPAPRLLLVGLGERGLLTAGGARYTDEGGRADHRRGGQARTLPLRQAQECGGWPGSGNVLARR